MIRRSVLTMSAVMLLGATTAQAEVMLTPFAGAAFSGSTDRTRPTFGLALGFLGAGVIGENDITADSPVPFSIRELWQHFDRKERVTYSDPAKTQEALIAEGDAATLTSARFQPHSTTNTAPYKPQPPPIMGSYVTKILARLKDRRFDFLLNTGTYDGVQRDIHDLMASWLDHEHSITVFDLGGVPFEIVDLVVVRRTPKFGPGAKL